MSATNLNEIKSLFKNYNRRENLAHYLNGTFLFHTGENQIRALIYNTSYSAPLGYANYKAEFASAKSLEAYIANLIEGNEKFHPHWWHSVTIRFTADPAATVRLDDSPPLTKEELINSISLPRNFDANKLFDQNGLPSRTLQRQFVKTILRPDA